MPAIYPVIPVKAGMQSYGNGVVLEPLRLQASGNHEARTLIPKAGSHNLNLCQRYRRRRYYVCHRRAA